MKFTPWQHWPARNNLGEILRYPGVYVVCFSPATPLDGKSFQWAKDIIYIGMTNSVTGLKGRLAQFDQTMRTSRVTHGGADRVRIKFPDYSRFVRSAYVAVCHMVCDGTANSPADLRKMGKVAEWEYVALATYAETFGGRPECNKRTAKKVSQKSKPGMGQW